jgi:hypothetical protein
MEGAMSEWAITGNSVASRDAAYPGKPASPESEKRVQDLKKRDAEVRAHEQAHLAAAGTAASGGASFSYTTGPDGKRYAEGGEVKIQLRSGRTPEETIRNAAQVEKAALAPANPSPQDLQVAASARQMQIKAQAEIAKREAAGAKSTKAGDAYGIGAAPVHGKIDVLG